MRQIGIGFVSGWSHTKEMVEFGKLAEKSGFQSAWVAEHTFFRDAFSSLGALALSTERIRLSTSIVNIYTRNPVQMAMDVATINELSHGRAMLGIGLGNPLRLAKLGVTVTKPLDAMREYVKIVRDLLAGNSLTFDGRTFKVHDTRLEFELTSKYVPIYLAAVNSKMLQLAGEIGDGVILTLGSSCDYVRRALKEVGIGIQRAGRGRGVDAVCLMVTSVSQNSQIAKAISKKVILPYVSHPGRGEMMFGPEYGEQLRLVREALRARDNDAALGHITDEMVDLVSLSGGPEECRQKLDEFIDAGITQPVIVPVPGSDFPAAIDTFRQC
jgi:5,10-methylenetetrahydromethanopterin reductase